MCVCWRDSGTSSSDAFQGISYNHCFSHVDAFSLTFKYINTVNRELLFIILGKLGCPQKFIRIIKKLFSDVRARVIADGELTRAFEYNCVVKEGYKLAPTLFGINAAVLHWLAFKKVKHTCNIKIRFRYDGELFDLRRLKA